MKVYLSDKSDKGSGFYATLLAAVLSLVAAFVYMGAYSRTRYMSWAAFAIIIVGVVITVAMVFLKLIRFAPTVMLASIYLAFMFYIYYIYFYISSVVYGIQYSGFPAIFYINIAFFLLAIIVSIVSIFLSPYKKNKSGVKN